MLSDRQLIGKIKRNRDRDAADELLGRYYKEIYAYAYRQSGNKELAMDLTQDIFVAILQGIDSFDERKAQFRTWVYHVAANKITDYYRSKAHKKMLAETSLFSEQAEFHAAAGFHSATEPHTDAGFHANAKFQPAPEAQAASEALLEQVLRRETIRQVMEIVVQFDTDWINIFRGKCFEEQTFSQIASQMKLPENTVKTRFYSMVRKIKKEVPFDEN